MVTWTRHREAVWLVLCGATFGAAWRLALLVGGVLTAINQGDVLLAGEATPLTWARVAANVAVPYLVASTGFLTACRAPRSQSAPRVSEPPRFDATG